METMLLKIDFTAIMLASEGIAEGSSRNSSSSGRSIHARGTSQQMQTGTVFHKLIILCSMLL
jgi:hypothetical protein